MHGLVEPRCPECGFGFALEDPRTFIERPCSLGSKLWAISLFGIVCLIAAIVIPLPFRGPSREGVGHLILACYVALLVLGYATELYVMIAAIGLLVLRRSVAIHRRRVLLALLISSAVVIGVPGLPMLALVLGCPFLG